MADYRGFDYTVEYDADYMEGLNWRFSVYKQTSKDYECLLVDYASTKVDAEKKAKEYIDMWKKANGRQ